CAALVRPRRHPRLRQPGRARAALPGRVGLGVPRLRPARHGMRPGRGPGRGRRPHRTRTCRAPRRAAAPPGKRHPHRGWPVKDVTVAVIISVPDDTDPEDVTSAVDFTLEQRDWGEWEVSESTAESVSAPYGTGR